MTHKDSKKFVIKYMTSADALVTIEASCLSYSGGDGVVVVAFLSDTARIISIAALQPGMIVVPA